MNQAPTQTLQRASATGVHSMNLQGEGPYLLQSLASDGYYKWWYFDIETKQGDIITIIFHENHMFCCNELPSVSLSFYDGSKGWRKFYNSQRYHPWDANGSPKMLKIGHSCISVDREATIVELALPRAKGHLTIRGTWEQADPVFGAQTDSFPGHVWRPILIGQPVYGVLELDGIPSVIQGTCYHDCNYGIGYLGTILKRWFWGRSYSGEMKLTFLILYPRHGLLCGTGILQLPDSRPQVIQIRRNKESGSNFDAKTGGDYFSDLSVDGITNRESLAIDMVFHGLVDAKVKKACAEGRQANMRYYRIMSEWEVGLYENGVHTRLQLQGLTEQMHF